MTPNPPAPQAAAPATVPPGWTCPDHGQPYDDFKSSEGGQEWWGCPEPGCKHGRWVS